MNDVLKFVTEFKIKLSKLKNKEKSELDTVVKEFRKKNPTLEKDKLFKLTKTLWCSSFHEEKTLAIKLLDSYNSYLSYKDMTLVEEMLSQSDDEDHVDEISCHLVQAIITKNKKAFNYINKWSQSSNFWMRKASLICQTRIKNNN